MRRLLLPPGLAALLLSPFAAPAQPATAALPRLTLEQAQDAAATRNAALSAARHALDAVDRRVAAGKTSPADATHALLQARTRHLDTLASAWQAAAAIARLTGR